MKFNFNDLARKKRVNQDPWRIYQNKYNLLRRKFDSRQISKQMFDYNHAIIKKEYNDSKFNNMMGKF